MIKIILKIKNNKGLAPYRRQNPSGSGFVILFAVTLASILLALALGVANIALKEIKFSTSAKNTNEAFFAADTGVEKALYNDKTPGFYPAGIVSSFAVFNLGSAFQSCAKVTVDKTALPITTIISKGYNISSNNNLCASTNPDRIERELKTTY